MAYKTLGPQCPDCGCRTYHADHCDGCGRHRDGCQHESVAEMSGYPSASGRCEVYAVCEDCGAELGQAGTDSV